MAVIILTCPECSTVFTKTAKRQTFCTPEHKRKFYIVAGQRGQLLITILLAKSELRHSKSPEDRKRAAQYRRWVDALAARFNIEDRKVGRRQDLVAKLKFDKLWNPNDLD